MKLQNGKTVYWSDDRAVLMDEFAELETRLFGFPVVWELMPAVEYHRLKKLAPAREAEKAAREPGVNWREWRKAEQHAEAMEVFHQQAFIDMRSVLVDPIAHLYKPVRYRKERDDHFETIRWTWTFEKPGNGTIVVQTLEEREVRALFVDALVMEEN